MATSWLVVIKNPESRQSETKTSPSKNAFKTFKMLSRDKDQPVEPQHYWVSVAC